MLTGVHLLNGAHAELTECWLRIDEQREGAADDPADRNTGLLVEGSGTQANATSCITHPIGYDDNGSENTVTAVAANSSAVVNAKNCHMKGHVVTEEAGEVKSVDPLEEIDTEELRSPAYIGVMTHGAPEGAPWAGLGSGMAKA